MDWGGMRKADKHDLLTQGHHQTLQYSDQARLLRLSESTLLSQNRNDCLKESENYSKVNCFLLAPQKKLLFKEAWWKSFQGYDDTFWNKKVNTIKSKLSVFFNGL